jgi:hypothetical protein
MVNVILTLCCVTLKISRIRNNAVRGIRVSQGEAHKLSDMLNQVILNKEHCINTCPISDICRVIGVESAEDCETLFYNCLKCLYVNIESD